MAEKQYWHVLFIHLYTYVSLAKATLFVSPLSLAYLWLG